MQFIKLGSFIKEWLKLGYSDEDLKGLEREIIGEIAKEISDRTFVPKGAGLEKIRYPLPPKGKSGGSRICYFYHQKKETVYIFYIYSKSNMVNIPNEVLNDLAKGIKLIKKQ